MSQIFTIGHSIDSIEAFIEHLKYHKIDTIVDVRSVPYSRFVNQFNKEKLHYSLKQKGILYVPMGDHLGAKHTEDDLLFDDGKVNYSKVTKTQQFQNGIERLEKGLEKGYNIALMCSEKNPLECHRFSLISHYLDKNGHEVKHLIKKNVYSHQFLQDNLLGYLREYQKITTDIQKITSYRSIQGALFETKSIDEEILYLKLNKLVGRIVKKEDI